MSIHITPRVRHLDVASAYPGGVEAAEGWDCSSSKKLRDVSLHRCEAGVVLSTVNTLAA